MSSTSQYWLAAEDFHRARRAADLEQVMARLTGKPDALLSYEDVRKKLHATVKHSEGVQDIPLDAIVGSVGRYTDFTRSFLPKNQEDVERWSRVFLATTGMTGVPPIEVYKVGSAYFVKDGHHRVSVARQLDAKYIQAHVIEVETKVPIDPDTDMEDLILKSEYADFLQRTKIDEQCPEADLQLTLPGQYEKLEEHIAVHRYFMGLEQQRDISQEEAVEHWYDEVYMPVVQVIRERGLLRDFPDRTETDLYLWVMEHRAELEEALGWQVDVEEAAADLAAEHSARSERVFARMGRRLRDALTPSTLEAGPPIGQWREERTRVGEERALFRRILVPIRGDETGWQALEQAIPVARREGGRLRGLHVLSPDADDEARAAAQAVQAEFNRRCEAAGIEGNLVIDEGEIAQAICQRSQWADLVVIAVAYPPEPQPISRLGSGFRTMIHSCPRPIMAVPSIADVPRSLQRALLAYDGSPKSQEALFVAAYLTGRWELPLTVLTVMEQDGDMSEVLMDAHNYLKARGIQAEFLDKRGPVADVILETAEERQADLILMGGYGLGPVVEVMLGSTVDEVLRQSHRPVLFCR
jgi:nucleotide-binding universal stress UspA family protein